LRSWKDKKSSREKKRRGMETLISIPLVQIRHRVEDPSFPLPFHTVLPGELLIEMIRRAKKNLNALRVIGYFHFKIALECPHGGCQGVADGFEKFLRASKFERASKFFLDMSYGLSYKFHNLVYQEKTLLSAFTKGKGCFSLRRSQAVIAPDLQDSNLGG